MEKCTPPPSARGHPLQVATPQRVQDVAAEGILKSTPSNHGSAAVSEHLSSVLVDDVSPLLLADIKDHITCPVKSLLKGLLSLCLPEEQKHDPPTDLLDDCLKAVLPICNVNAKPAGLKMREYLEEYCKIRSDEVGRYRPFVYAFNYALRALNDLNLPLREPPALDLLFHRNDPKLIVATHKGNISERKPDIILVPLNAAQNAFSEGDPGRWDDHALNTAADPPNNAFDWGNLRLSAEFRATAKHISPPPPEYVLKPPQPIAPQSLPTNIDEGVSSMQSHSNSCSGKGPMTPVEATSIELRRSQRLLHADKIPAMSSSSGRQKRSRENSSQSSNKKAKLALVTLPKRLPAAIQSALYAAERMSHAFWISHAINLVVIDDIAYVWWYDTQGTIQSHGINFIQDLPYFLVLLLCFQRFDERNWGVISSVSHLRDGKQRFSLPASGDSPLVNIVIDPQEKLHGHYGIVGRATQVLLASSGSPDPRVSGKTLKGLELVVKVYWPEESRVGEDRIVQAAQRIGEENNKVKGHLPDLICSRDFGEYSTANIRHVLSLSSRGRRILRVILFRRMYPITDLIGEKFWKAFWDCFRCHHHLWVGGVQHNDISVKNLMYDKLNDGRGILNDYDLAYLVGKPRPTGTERTGTMPFMALDLLTEEAWKGKVPRLYRHDCESFAWVLLWICCRYGTGEEISNPPLREFITHDYKRCFDAKHAIISKLNSILPTPTYAPFWKATQLLLKWPLEARQEYEAWVVFGQGTDRSEPTMDQVVEKYQQALESAGFSIDLF